MKRPNTEFSENARYAEWTDEECTEWEKREGLTDWTNEDWARWEQEASDSECIEELNPSNDDESFDEIVRPLIEESEDVFFEDVLFAVIID